MDRALREAIEIIDQLIAAQVWVQRNEIAARDRALAFTTKHKGRVIGQTNVECD